MKLGSYAHFSVSVVKLDESLPFYLQIGFRKLWENTEPKPWALLTDGRMNLHLFESEFSSPAIHYFSSSMEKQISELERLGLSLEQQKSKDGNRLQHTFLDPNELNIMLMHHDDAEMPKPSGSSHSLLGSFGELSINTDDIHASLVFWQKLDFISTYQSDRPYPWVLLSDGTLTIGLHETKNFSVPAFTFVSPDIAMRVAVLENDGVPLRRLQNESGLQGALLTAPDGQLFFLLKGDV